MLMSDILKITMASAATYWPISSAQFQQWQNDTDLAGLTYLGTKQMMMPQGTYLQETAAKKPSSRAVDLNDVGKVKTRRIVLE